MMERENNKIQLLDLTTKYAACKKWQSEMLTWQERIEFMKDKLIQFIGAIENKNRRIEARSFFNELDGRLKGSLEWLVGKLEIHEMDIKSFYKKNNLKSILEVSTQHDMYEKEVAMFKNRYSEMRTDFFELMKPILKNAKIENQLKSVA